MINKGRYEERLWLANHALAMIRKDPVAAAWFAGLGFDAESVSAGMEICRDTDDALHDRRAMHAESLGATDQKREMLAQARSRHTTILQLARLVITDEEGRARLGLAGRQPEAVDAWHNHANCFYESLEAQDLEKLAAVGVTTQRISFMQHLLTLSIDATAAAKLVRAAALASTVRLRAALKRLAKMMSEISVLARVGAAGKSNLVVLLKLSDRMRPELSPYPESCDPDEIATQPNPSDQVWRWFHECRTELEEPEYPVRLAMSRNKRESW